MSEQENPVALVGTLPQWMKPSTMEAAIQLADLFAKSDFVPTAHKGKPGNILVAMQVAASLDVPLLPVLQNIAVINGRPTVWGDFALALCKRHPEFEDIHEEIEEGPNGLLRAVCTITRKGQTTYRQTFSSLDAKQAGLWDKSGPWKQYPKRMLTMRARSWAMRGTFPDALLGLMIREEAEDIPPEKPATVVGQGGGVASVKAALGITVSDPVEAAMPAHEAAEMPPEIQPEDDAPVYGDPTDKPAESLADQLKRRVAATKTDMRSLCEAVLGRVPTQDNPLHDDDRAKLLDELEVRFGKEGA